MHAMTLRTRLKSPGMVQAPGCYDAFSARLIERAGFEVAYMTGFGSSASVLGMPDAGLMSFAEMADHAGRIANAINIPLIADGDTGYGNALNTHRTVQAYIRAGVAGIQLEDQVAPKKCGHTKGKQVIPAGEMVGKIRAASDAREAGDIVLVIRTDARAVNGFDDALERCRAYAEAGADVIFFEAPENEQEMRDAVQAIDSPMLVNVVEGGKTPCLPARELEQIGFKIAIYPVSLLLSAAKVMQKQLEALKKPDQYDLYADQITFEELKDLVGFPEYYAREDRYVEK